MSSPRTSEYLCGNPKCNSHCLTVLQKNGVRRFLNGLGIELNKTQLAQYDRGEYCDACENMLKIYETLSLKITPVPTVNILASPVDIRGARMIYGYTEDGKPIYYA